MPVLLIYLLFSNQEWRVYHGWSFFVPGSLRVWAVTDFLGCVPPVAISRFSNDYRCPSRASNGVRPDVCVEKHRVGRAINWSISWWHILFSSRFCTTLMIHRSTMHKARITIAIEREIMSVGRQFRLPVQAANDLHI